MMPSLTELIWSELVEQSRTPRAFYRLQFGPSFTFKDAERLIPYLDALGISDLYASPIFKPRSESTHGYDTVNYNALNPALGTQEEFDQLCGALKERGMSMLLDIVPNHMGVSTENEWWTDVLKHGPSSKYATYFDIDWKPYNRILENKVLLPILHSHYGEVLEDGHLKVVYWHGDFYVHYYDHQFPMTPESYLHILDHLLDNLPEKLDHQEEWIRLETESLRRSLQYLPAYWLTDEHSMSTRRREQKIIRWRFLGLFDKSEVFRHHLQAALDTINGTKGTPASFDTLDVILSEQPYHLAYWQVASDEINYRRFFDVNDMAAIRTENLQVFVDTHRLTFKLLATGAVSGLRIDHPDGLWNPERYFWRLQKGYVDAYISHRIPDNPSKVNQIADHFNHRLDTDEYKSTWPLYVLGEKILSDSEPLPESWAVHGTTGYEFMYMVGNLFIDSTSEEAFDQLYEDFTGEYFIFEELTDFTKKLIMSQSLTSEITALTAELARIVEQNRRFRGYTQNILAVVLSEFMSALNIYRTYITGPNHVSKRDQSYIEAAMTRAKQNNPLIPKRVFDFLLDVLLMRNLHLFNEEHHDALKNFVMKFQQITGPIMAKSVEDTAFYIYNRLCSLNEVGGHPDHFGISIQDFHQHNAAIKSSYPQTMVSTSTHDTKRSEDVRCRLHVLSEMPAKWHNAINTWSALNGDALSSLDGQPAPSRNDEYLIYQTLLGTYIPSEDQDVYVGRIIRYMHKAINEAKIHSNWINPNHDYAEAISSFIRKIWANNAFRTSFDLLYQEVAFFGRINSLSQVLLKLTCPGIPDIYQGTELWDYSLVDPDNRRPVDFTLRAVLLESLKNGLSPDRKKLAEDLLSNDSTGAIKLYIVYQALRFRSQHESLFSEGKYTPVESRGDKAEHVCCFERTEGDKHIVVVVPRLCYSLMKGEPALPIGMSAWGNTTIKLGSPGDVYKNILTDERAETDKKGKAMMGTVFSSIPYALLVREEQRG